MVVACWFVSLHRIYVDSSSGDDTGSSLFDLLFFARVEVVRNVSCGLWRKIEKRVSELHLAKNFQRNVKSAVVEYNPIHVRDHPIGLGKSPISFRSTAEKGGTMSLFVIHERTEKLHWILLNSTKTFFPIKITGTFSNQVPLYPRNLNQILMLRTMLLQSLTTL